MIAFARRRSRRGPACLGIAGCWGSIVHPGEYILMRGISTGGDGAGQHNHGRQDPPDRSPAGMDVGSRVQGTSLPPGPWARRYSFDTKIGLILDRLSTEYEDCRE